jgi:hypothetical protein
MDITQEATRPIGAVILLDLVDVERFSGLKLGEEIPKVPHQRVLAS